MTPHGVLDEEARDRAALHVLGCLEGGEQKAYETHLLGCASCQAEVESLREVIASLALASPGVRPPATLRSRVFENIRKNARHAMHPDAPSERPHPAQTWKGWAAASEPAAEPFLFALAADAVWEPTGMEGVQARRLLVDPAHERVTMLIRMGPHTSYPPHRHNSDEECYVIDGEILVGERRMRAGDYQMARCGSIHPVQSTENGCLLLIVSGLEDDILPGAEV